MIRPQHRADLDFKKAEKKTAALNAGYELDCAHSVTACENTTEYLTELSPSLKLVTPNNLNVCNIRICKTLPRQYHRANRRQLELPRDGMDLLCNLWQSTSKVEGCNKTNVAAAEVMSGFFLPCPCAWPSLHLRNTLCYVLSSNVLQPLSAHIKSCATRFQA